MTYVAVQTEHQHFEDDALATLRALGVPVRANEPCDPRPNDCTFCDFHAFDAAGVELDGGRASSLLSYHRDGYIAIAYLRPVRR